MSSLNDCESADLALLAEVVLSGRMGQVADPLFLYRFYPHQISTEVNRDPATPRRLAKLEGVYFPGVSPANRRVRLSATKLPMYGGFLKAWWRARRKLTFRELCQALSVILAAAIKRHGIKYSSAKRSMLYGPPSTSRRASSTAGYGALTTTGILATPQRLDRATIRDRRPVAEYRKWPPGAGTELAGKIWTGR